MKVSFRYFKYRFDTDISNPADNQNGKNQQLISMFFAPVKAATEIVSADDKTKIKEASYSFVIKKLRIQKFAYIFGHETDMDKNLLIFSDTGRTWVKRNVHASYWMTKDLIKL